MGFFFRVLVLDAKILVMAHNLPSRLFQQWHYKVLNLPETHLGYEAPREDEPVEAIICECLTAVLKLGKHLQKYLKVWTLELSPAEAGHFSNNPFLLSPPPQFFF